MAFGFAGGGTMLALAARVVLLGSTPVNLMPRAKYGSMLSKVQD